MIPARSPLLLPWLVAFTWVQTPLRASADLPASAATSVPAAEAAQRVAVQGRQFILLGDGPARPFTPWGFNYDRTVADGRDMLLEDALRDCPAVVDGDFAAMHRLGGNVVRVFIGTADILQDARTVSAAGLARLDLLLETARRNRLKLILVGLATLRPATIPKWMQDASDDDMEGAEKLFWQTVAAHCRARPEIFTYDLQNEPVVHWSDSPEWIIGCFDMPDGQKFCYVHRHCRQISRKWTRHVHQVYGTEEQLRRKWADYPRTGESWSKIAIPPFDGKDPRFAEYAAWHGGLLGGWARSLASTIRSVDPTHLITVGALDPAPVAGAVDFHCYHLYPAAARPGEDFLAANRREFAAIMARVPADKPLVIEEFYPLWKPEGVSCPDVLKLLLETTRNRCSGWVSFYWGDPGRMTWGRPGDRLLYESWVQAWSRAAATASSRPG